MQMENDDSLSRVAADPPLEAVWRDLLAHLPVAAYTCDVAGRLTYFNSLAEAVWGRAATLRDATERYCGSYRMYSPDGTLVPHCECWMARALSEGRAYNGYEVVIERQNGTRTLGLAYANPVRNYQRQIIGAINLVIAMASPGSSSANSSDERGLAIEDDALAIAEVALGLFANLAWPTETFN